MRLHTLFLALAVLISAGAQADAKERLDPGFEKLVDKYLTEIRGVGVDRVPDTMSKESFAAKVEKSRALLAELEAIDRDKLAFVQDIDWRFMKSLLEANIIEGERVQRWRQDPRTYLNNREVAFKIIADPRPVATRAAELIDDISRTPRRISTSTSRAGSSCPTCSSTDSSSCSRTSCPDSRRALPITACARACSPRERTASSR